MNRPRRHTLPGAGDVLAQKYRVDRILGQGGMGVVVAAWHLTLEQSVALKLLHPEAVATPEAVERFLREARAVARLKSEHVARVLDAGTLEGGEPFMAMELLEGSDLERVLRAHGPLPVRDAVEYVRQACEGMAEAHERGIVHRDLKPANLFLTTDARGRARVKVLDFGISKTVAGTELALTAPAGVVGSPLYMSPEQMRAGYAIDARSDVWSLGVTLYELLAGRAPFFSESTMELGAKVVHEPPEPLGQFRADVPGAIVELIERCLAKDPAERPGSAGELEAALAAALGPVDTSRPTSAPSQTTDAGPAISNMALPRTPVSRPATREATRRGSGRGRVLVGAGVAAIALGVAAVLVVPRSATRRQTDGASMDLRTSAVASLPSAPPTTTWNAPDAGAAVAGERAFPVSTAPGSAPAPGPKPRAASAGGRRAGAGPAATASGSALAAGANPLDHM